MPTLIEELKKDIRFIEGLNSCINCGTCTAICPAAQFYPYDPRLIADAVQSNHEGEIENLLKSNTIWYCGECLSCKTRCPQGNTPGYLIQALRALSIKTGLFMESEQGRKQLALKRTIGEHILTYGYCVYIDEVNTGMYPEQGPVWDWLKKNLQTIAERLHLSYRKRQSGTLRQIDEEGLNHLRRIFDETGATAQFDQMEKLGALKAREMNMDDQSYFNYLYNTNPEDNEQK